MYAYQHKAIKKGTPPYWRMAVDYNETHAGTSLTHSVATADGIFEHDGRLAYHGREEIHYLGCIVHAPGQSGNLIEQGIQTRLLQAYRKTFTAVQRKEVEMYTSFAKIHLH